MGFLFLFSFSVNAAEIPLATLEFPPENFKKDGKIVGLSVDIVTEVMKRMGHTVNIKLYPFKRGRLKTEAGEVAGIFTIGKSPERAKKFYYPNTPLTILKNVFLKKKDRNIIWSTMEDLKDYRIGYGKGYDYKSPFMEAVNAQMFRTIGVVGATPNERLIKILLVDRADLIICEMATCGYILKYKFPDINTIEPIPKTVGQPIEHYLAFSKEWPGAKQLTQDFDKEMIKFLDSKELKDIFNKWGVAMQGTLTLK